MTVETTPVSERTVIDQREAPRRWSRVTLALRPCLIAAASAVLVLALFSVAPRFDPFSPLVRYALRTGELAAVALGATVIWWARRGGRSWDADVVPAITGLVMSAALLTVLHGTPYAPWGLQGDQSFRTESITRFAQTWQPVDYFYRGLPAYYAPAFFWVAGRAAALSHVAPWHMLKYGTILGAFLVPLIGYLLWRRIVPARTAALLAATALVAQSFYEPYSWIVLTAIVPWWLETSSPGLTRAGLRPRPALVQGLIGGLLFLTYYYYFFVLPIVLVLQVLVERRRATALLRDVRRTLTTLAVAAAVSAVYWAPLLVNFLTSPEFSSLNNRYFRPSFAELALPFTQPTPIGALCLVGLGFLVWTARREALSRSLLVILVALYVWHAAGFLLAAAGTPLMSFKMRELVTVILLASGILALVRMAGHAVRRFPAADARRLTVAVGMVLALAAADGYVTSVLNGKEFPAAHSQPLPGDQLPPFHSAGARPANPSAERLRAEIDSRWTAARTPVVLSDRVDLYALYPYYGFVQWQAHYSNPTAEFRNRLAFLRQAATAATAADFSSRTARNRFDAIDVIVLRQQGGSLTFRYTDDAFPNGSAPGSISIPARLVAPPYFDTVMVGDCLVAVRRT